MDSPGQFQKLLCDAVSWEAAEEIEFLEVQSYALLADVRLSCQVEIEEHLQRAISRFVASASPHEELCGAELAASMHILRWRCALTILAPSARSGSLQP